MRDRRTSSLTILFFAALAVLFLVANRGAYEGYFQDDDLDNLGWTHFARVTDFVSGVLTPRYFPGNFRPAGHFYYYAMGSAAGLTYPPYVAVLHVLHFFNVIVVWLLMRRLGVPTFAAGCAAALFAFHMAVFDAYWRPMYIFDVLCATFSLLSILAYVKRHWIVGLAFLWLAYKSKELAVMVPAVLAVYEFTLGERKWKLLAPYFAISLLFSVQALLLNPNVDNDYTMRFTSEALWTTLSFYAPKLAPLGWAALALVLLPFFFPDRRIWFGIAMTALVLMPMLLLPGRLYPAYLYLPLAGLAIAAGALFSKWHWAIPAVIVIAWLPWNYSELRNYRRTALTVAAENKAYVQGLRETPLKSPDVRKFIYDGKPEAMHPWGIAGALRLIHKGTVELKSIEDKQQFDIGRVALITWDPVERKLYTTAGSLDRPEASYIQMGSHTPVWQLKDGWFPRENRYRWTRPRATAQLYRPSGAREFEVVVNAGPGQIRDLGRVILTMAIGGVKIGTAEFRSAEIHTVRWNLPAGEPGPVNVEFRTQPEYKTHGDPRTFGAAIVAFGFRP